MKPISDSHAARLRERLEEMIQELNSPISICGTVAFQIGRTGPFILLSLDQRHIDVLLRTAPPHRVDVIKKDAPIPPLDEDMSNDC